MDIGRAARIDQMAHAGGDAFLVHRGIVVGPHPQHHVGARFVQTARVVRRESVAGEILLHVGGAIGQVDHIDDAVFLKQRIGGDGAIAAVVDRGCPAIQEVLLQIAARKRPEVAELLVACIVGAIDRIGLRKHLVGRAVLPRGVERDGHGAAIAQAGCVPQMTVVARYLDRGVFRVRDKHRCALFHVIAVEIRHVGQRVPVAENDIAAVAELVAGLGKGVGRQLGHGGAEALILRDVGGERSGFAVLHLGDLLGFGGRGGRGRIAARRRAAGCRRCHEQGGKRHRGDKPGGRGSA